MHGFLKVYSRRFVRVLVGRVSILRYLVVILPKTRSIKCSDKKSVIRYAIKGLFTYIARYSKKHIISNASVSINYGGNEVCLDLDLSEYTQCGYYFECPNPELMSLIKKGGATFIDVGTNVGIFSLLASKAFDKVISFEPGNEAHTRLKNNIKINGFNNIVVEKKGVSESAKSMTLYENPINLGGSSLEGFSDDYVNSLGKREWLEYQVDIVSLDQYFLDNSIENVDLIKIDVEGHEVSVIKGALKTLDLFEPVLFIEAHSREHFFQIKNIVPNKYRAWDPVLKVAINENDKYWECLNVVFSVRDPWS